MGVQIPQMCPIPHPSVDYSKEFTGDLMCDRGGAGVTNVDAPPYPHVRFKSPAGGCGMGP